MEWWIWALIVVGVIIIAWIKVVVLKRIMAKRKERKVSRFSDED